MYKKFKSNKGNSYNSTKVFKTADFILSVFLLYSGVNLIDVESFPDVKNQNRKQFVFEKTEQLEDLMNHFISSDPTVKIKKLFSVQKELKKKIYS